MNHIITFQGKNPDVWRKALKDAPTPRRVGDKICTSRILILGENNTPYALIGHLRAYDSELPDSVIMTKDTMRVPYSLSSLGTRLEKEETRYEPRLVVVGGEAIRETLAHYTNPQFEGINEKFMVWLHRRFKENRNGGE